MSISIDKVCGAVSVEGWAICLWGNPKLSVVCGNCKGPFSTRQYAFITNKGRQIAVFCPHCQYYNLTGLYPNED